MMPFKLLALLAVAVCSLQAVHCAEGDYLARASFLSGDEGWTLEGRGFSSQGLQHEFDRLVVEDDRSDAARVWYFQSSADFLGGDKSLAYNGWLTFEFGHFEYESAMEPMISDYDVVLVCKNQRQNLGIKGIFIDDGATAHTYQVRLEETFRAPKSTASWVRTRSGLQAAQRDMVQCLQSLKAIRIRGSYFKGYEAVWLRDVSILQGGVSKPGSDQWEASQAVKDPNAVDNRQLLGTTDYMLRQKAVTGDGSCCASRTCVSNDKYEIIFDRPGCTTDWDNKCDAVDATNRITQIVQARSLLEGREHVMDQAFIGLRGKVLQKPFRHPYYFKSTPRICTAATLTVAAHGDLAYTGDNVVVYGEDGRYLGTLFAGNLTYEKEDPYYSQTSESTPYIDSIVISQSEMTQYSADEQIKIVLASERHLARQGESGFKSGTHLAHTLQTSFCDSAPCDLKGGVIIRWMKLTFSAAACYSAKKAGITASYKDDVHAPQPVNLSLSFKTPTGDASVPGGDGVLTVVTDADLFERHETLEVRTAPAADGTLGEIVGELFSSEAFTRKQKADFTLAEWQPPSGSDNIPRFYADTARISRAKLQSIVAGGTANLQLYSTRPDNTAKYEGTFSPIFLSYPLMHCFMHAIKKGPYMNVHIERPSRLHFVESGFPMAGGDVTLFIATHWQGHLRYPTDTSNDNTKGNLPELPGERADQDTTASATQAQMEAHREWPHGYSYMQLRAGLDGEWLADMFLKDFTQYDPRGYIIDTITIPKEKFNILVSGNSGYNQGEFPFSIWVPPGYGVVQLRSLVVSYPVANLADASKFDDATFETSFVNPRYPQPLA